MAKTQGFSYLLIFIDTFTRWIEAFPTKTERATEVCKALLKEIVPMFGLPRSLQSDNGPSFTATISQNLAACSGIKYLLQHGKSFIFQLSGGHCNGIKHPTHLHLQVINHYSDFFGNFFFILPSLDGLLKIVAPFLHLYSPTACLGDLFFAQYQCEIHPYHCVILRCGCSLAVTGHMGVWCGLLYFNNGFFFPVLTSVLFKWLPTCSTLY